MGGALFVIALRAVAAEDALPETLKTKGLTEAEWRRSVAEALTWGLVQGLVLMDLIKAALLAVVATVTHTQEAVRWFPKNSVRRAVFLSPLHRLYYVVEACS